MSTLIPVDIKGFANQILDWADEIGSKISPMKLQKLVYYCHSDFLITFEKPLIAQEFEAWEFGPVEPSLYREFKHYGSEPIVSRACRFDPVTAKTSVALSPTLEMYSGVIRDSFDCYVRLTAGTLSTLSHIEQGPWHEALAKFNRGDNVGRKISNLLILKHHRYTSLSSRH